jgi:RHS repeat-associated protein
MKNKINISNAVKYIILIALLRIFLQARYYNPDISRFICADTITPGGENNAQGLNRYTYCGNNPVKYVDPSGHEYKDVQLKTSYDSAAPAFAKGLSLSLNNAGGTYAINFSRTYNTSDSAAMALNEFCLPLTRDLISEVLGAIMLNRKGNFYLMGPYIGDIGSSSIPKDIMQNPYLTALYHTHIVDSRVLFSLSDSKNLINKNTLKQPFSVNDINVAKGASLPLYLGIPNKMNNIDVKYRIICQFWPQSLKMPSLWNISKPVTGPDPVLLRYDPKTEFISDVLKNK